MLTDPHPPTPAPARPATHPLAAVSAIAVLIFFFVWTIRSDPRRAGVKV